MYWRRTDVGDSIVIIDWGQSLCGEKFIRDPICQYITWGPSKGIPSLHAWSGLAAGERCYIRGCKMHSWHGW